MKIIIKLLKSIAYLLVITVLAGVLVWFFVPHYLKQIPIVKNYDLPSAEALLKGEHKESLIEHALKHSDPNYVCPMHPQIIKGEPGNCPICGMDLVKKEPMEAEPAKAKAEKKILFWVAPMDANYRSDKPGKSPMGMDLVPVYDEATSSNNQDNDDELPKITVKAHTVQKMGIRTQTVTKQRLSRTIHTIGSISYNEDSLHHVHSRTDGWVERIYAKAEGEQVTRGHPLVDFYSPDIVAAQKDLLIAKTSGKLFSQKGSVSLIESAKQRLRLLEIPESIIKRVHTSGKSQDRVPILAPASGIIINMGIRDGMYVTPSLEMYAIANLSSIWVQVDVFEDQLSWVKVGNKAEMQVQGLPGKTWTGKIDYIYPELNPVNRTLRVRLKFKTPKHQLKPNMFADVTLFAKAKTVLSVPAETMIYYANSPRVIKVTGNNQYQPVEVKTGMKSSGQVEILEGLKAGDKIVVSGQFLLDSESNLQASFRRMTPVK